MVAYPLNTIQNSHFRFRDVLSSKSWEDAQNHDQASEEEVKVDKRIGQVEKQVNWQLLISFVIVVPRRGLMERCSSWLGKRMEATATSPEPRPVKVASNLTRRFESCVNSNRLTSPHRSPPVPPRGRLVPWSSVPSVYCNYFLGSHHFNLAAVDPVLGPVILSIKFDLDSTSSLILLRLPYGAFMLQVLGPPPKSSLTLARLVCPALALTSFHPLFNPATSTLLATNYRGTASLYLKLLGDVTGEKDTLPRPCCVPSISTPSTRSRKPSTTSTEFSFSCFNASNEELDQEADHNCAVVDLHGEYNSPPLKHYPSGSMTVSSGRFSEGDWGSDYQLLLSHPLSPSDANTPSSTLSSTLSSSSPRLPPTKLRLLPTPSKVPEHVNLITMMAKLTTEEESNQAAALAKELQYLEVNNHELQRHLMRSICRRR